LILTILLVFFSHAPAQEEQNARQIYSYDNLPPRELVDCPTAANLPRASFDFRVRTTSNGGLITQIHIGLHRRFSLGLSYGGEQVLGEGTADWYEHVTFMIKYQLVNETIITPAFTIGYDGQGSGRYFSDLDRFMYKSKGFYLVVSKGYQTYQWASGLHVGINYSLESDGDNDDDVTFFFGADLSLQNDLLLVAEYDLALNDNIDAESYIGEHSGKGWGYLNVGLRWIFSERLELGLDFQNLFDNRRDTRSFTRGLRITYLEFF
ncbi:MAG: hypothetical protein KAT58_02495, partial [candidate division Zixibacteria bacterium]|nr:hypothetical protein [candidate division Zixibacteria bacterium]